MTTDPAPKQVKVWLIDGFNVLHACVLTGRERGLWWHADAQAALVAWLEPFARRHRVLVLFDASSERSPRYRGDDFSARISFAPDVDDAIVQSLLGEFHECRDRVCVVTADRSLGDRCRARRARVMRPWAFADLVHAAASARRPPGGTGESPPAVA